MADIDPKSPNRRRFIVGTALAGAAAIAMPMISFGRHAVMPGSDKRYSTRAVDLVRETLVLDMLGVLKLVADDDYYASPIPEKDALEILSSGITGFHNALGFLGHGAFDDVLHHMAAVQGFVGRNTHVFSLVGRTDDLRRAKREGRVAVIVGVQNADHFRTSADVGMFYKLGMRCAQLTYNSQNFLGSGSTERVDGGLTDYGIEIVGAMNEVGMLIDVSHCGERTTLDAIELSKQPIAITHSNCQALNNHPRLKSDEVIRKLAVKGGVMGVTGVRNFVRDREPTTVEHVVDHIDHIAKLVGIEHAGIGSDADLHGYDAMPQDVLKRLRDFYKDSYAFRGKLDTDRFNHPLKIYDLTEALITRGYSDADISGVLGGNFMRLLESIWR